MSPHLDLHFSGANVTVRARISTSHCLKQNLQFSNVGLKVVGLFHSLVMSLSLNDNDQDHSFIRLSVSLSTRTAVSFPECQVCGPRSIREQRRGVLCCGVLCCGVLLCVVVLLWSVATFKEILRYPCRLPALVLNVSPR